MSIKETAKQIIHDAYEFMDKNHDLNYFNITIGQKNISLTIDNYSIAIKRWYGEQYNHHFYEISTQGYTGGFEELAGPFSDGLVYVQRYLEAYREFKDFEGYILVTNEGRWFSKSAWPLFDKFEQTSFTAQEKKLISKNLYTENKIEFIAGVVSDDFTSFIKDSAQSISVIREVVSELSICSLMHGKIDSLIIQSIGLAYHGETITVYIDQTEKKMVARLNTTQEVHLLDLPLQKQHMVNLLQHVEEKNKIKNLLEPSHIFFSEFIKDHLLAYGTSKHNEQDEFDKLVANFETWMDVEMIFKEIIEENQPYVSTHRALMNYTDVNSYASTAMESSCVKYKEHYFFFIKHRINNNNSKETFRVFLSNSNKPPQAFNDYLVSQLNHTIETTTKDL